MSTTIRTIERPPQQHTDQPAPLLLLLHGYGSNEHDLMGLAPYLDPRLHIVSARAIYNLGDFGDFESYAWYHLYGTPGNLRTDETSCDHALKVLTSLVRTLPARTGTDPARTFILGFSQGAVMTLALALTAPELVRGIIPVSGYLEERIAAKSQTSGLAGRDILAIHGTEDDLIPVTAGRRIRDFLQTTPAQWAYEEYPVGHGIHADAVYSIARWLSARVGA